MSIRKLSINHLTLSPRFVHEDVYNEEATSTKDVITQELSDLTQRAQRNVAHYLIERAISSPDTPAIIMPEPHYNQLGKRLYSHLTFLQLNRLCDAYAHALTQQGLRPGKRVLLMVSQGLELIAITFALFKVGAIPVLIDPGMGLKSFLSCVRQVQPEAMIGIPKAYLPRHLFRKTFASLEKEFVTHGKWYLPANDLSALADYNAGPYPPYNYAADPTQEELAAILFTSGSTGPPKGVNYTQRIFSGQSHAIQRMYNIQPGEICVPAFPLFALFSTAMGSTCVIPDFDPSSPANINPENMLEAISDFGATLAFGSPAIWKQVVHFCLEHGELTLPSISRLLLFGAPIDLTLTKNLLQVFPNATLHTPFGATESLPVASIDSDTILNETAQMTRQGKGICVGEPIPSVDVRIIQISDEPIPTADLMETQPIGTIGEIAVSGETVTSGYWEQTQHNALSKISDPNTHSGFWHRMGDVGYLDEKGRIWYCGRKGHRVIIHGETHFTIPCEAIINTHPAVYRSALVPSASGDGATIVVELEKDIPQSEELKQKLLKLAGKNPITRIITEVIFFDHLPVDRRHNAKIHRPEIAEAIKKRSAN